MEINKKPKIVMVVDQHKWAFGISARDMVKFMGDKYEFKIIAWEDNPKNPKHYEGADLVYLFGNYMDEWMPEGFNFNKSCAGVRALFGYIDDPTQRDQKQDPWTSDKTRQILKYPMIHVVSEELYDLFKDFHPDVSVVCHGVDTDFYYQKKDYVKHRPFVLGWAGNRGNLVKGISLVEDTLNSGRTDTILKTAEFGEKQLNTEQLRGFYHSLDAFVLPSISEGCSAALLEAMSCGLPIIATDTGSWIELKTYGGGYTIERTNASINDALNKLTSASAGQLKEMGDKNRQAMLEVYDWRIKAKDFEKFFDKALEHKKTDDKTIKCFEEKWKMMPKGYGLKDAKQIEFFLYWAVKKYGMKNIDELNKFYESKKNILEIGFGSAFNMKYISGTTDGNITGVDTSKTACELAGILFKNNSKIKIVNGRILNTNLEDESFDLIIADGVLHHLENPQKAVDFLYNKLAHGGHMYVYFYRKMGKIREFTNDYMRIKMQKLTPKECVKACEPLTRLAQKLSAIKDKIKIDEDIPLLNLGAGEYTPHEIFYYGVMKAFWNDVFSFEENNMNNYDWFYPEFANRYSEDEIVAWLKKLGCKFKINNANPNGISVLIEKL